MSRCTDTQQGKQKHLSDTALNMCIMIMTVGCVLPRMLSEYLTNPETKQVRKRKCKVPSYLKLKVEVPT